MHRGWWGKFLMLKFWAREEGGGQTEISRPPTEGEGDKFHLPPSPCPRETYEFFSIHLPFQRSHSSCGEVHTTAEVLFTMAQVSADVTLLDRLQPLLATPTRSQQVTLRSSGLEKMKHSLYMTSSNIHTIGLVRLLCVYMYTQRACMCMCALVCGG